jgi:hypothetical protein
MSWKSKKACLQYIILFLRLLDLYIELLCYDSM